MRARGNRVVMAGMVTLSLLAAPAWGFWPFGGGDAEVEEVRDTQKKILERLDAQDKVLQEILGRISGRGAGAPGAAAANVVHDIPVGSSVIRGPKNAPVTLVEFSDFQCPFCAQAAMLPEQLLKQYPKELRFVYKQFPLTQIHPHAMRAAKASIAAGKQGKFWEMHDKLFENSRQLSEESVNKMAKDLGLDMKKFEKDIGSAQIEKEVQEDMALATKVGVRGTPTFFLNGRQVQNRSPEAMKAMIDAELKKKGG